MLSPLAHPLLSSQAMNFRFASRLGRLFAARHLLAATWVVLIATWLPDVALRWVLSLLTVAAYVGYEFTRKHAGRVADAHRRIQGTADLNLTTLEALARAIDAKDRPSGSHLKRVQHYASRLAETSGLSPRDVQSTRMAALLHDVGKLAVSEHILSKPGPLTQEEFQKVKIHSQVGAEIVSSVPLMFPVSQLILSHHERWDGRGYPQGIAGEAIPIGARILSVVDFYDSVTTDRPYHAALSHESAVNLMRYEAGKTLDLTLVATFLSLLPSLEAEMAIHAPSDSSSSAVSESTARGSSAFDSIALAHREMYALYEIAQSMGTSLRVSETMELIAEKLGAVIPWSGCVLYVTEPDSDRLLCQFAMGTGVQELLHTSISSREGPAGRAAATCRSPTSAVASQPSRWC